MANLQHQLRRLARAMQDRAEKKPGGTTFVNGTIVTVTPGAARDGLAQVTVNVNGSTLPAPCLASYTPVQGDMVRVELTAGSPTIHGKVQNLPAF